MISDCCAVKKLTRIMNHRVIRKGEIQKSISVSWIRKDFFKNNNFIERKDFFEEGIVGINEKEKISPEKDISSRGSWKD